MTVDLDRDGWLRSITLRLRSHYATAGDQVGARGSERYRILEEIDRGGMGRVLLAEDLSLGRRVALKTTPEGRADDRMRARLMAEARIISQLHHPGIVPIHDAGIDSRGEPYFAMQLVAGDSLAAILGGDPRPVARLVEILQRVCETMAYAHSRGVVHRDLKPANIMVGAYGEVYVMDWGLARLCDRPAPAPVPDSAPSPVSQGMTQAGSVLGTPSYMAPEQAAAQAGGDPAADIYGLGAVLYEILTRQAPYTSEKAEWTVEEILAAVRDGPPTPVPQLSPEADQELVAICERAMHRDARHRYQSMAALGADLRAWAEHRVVTAHGASLSIHLRKWLRRHRELAVTAGVAVLVLLGSTVWFVLHLAAAKGVAEASMKEILDLSVVEQVRDLRRRADRDLWPATTARIPAMEAWLKEAEGLRPARASLAQRRRDWNDSTSDPVDTWRRRLLDDAVRVLDGFFAEPETKAILSLGSEVAAVRRRIGYARRLEQQSLHDPEAKAAWEAARGEIRTAPIYNGLDLAPQAGLLPLGFDPDSGLYEFAHLQSGRPACRGGDGHLRLDSDSGLVLVLIPKGRFAMGAQTKGTRNLDPFAEEINESPVHDVTLDAFFLSKWEMTQGQWLRATGHNPSVHTKVSLYVEDDRAPLHPVESIDWHEARRLLPRLGLDLPTEAQWEYAARAGTTTPWTFGQHIEDLVTPPAGNLADSTSARALGTKGWVPTPDLTDGFVMHAPVGTFAPNAFGLYDTLGNVWEWCRDEYRSYKTPAAPGDGARPLSREPGTVMYRGGAFDQPAQEARSANRAGAPPTRRHFSIGVRPVRSRVRSSRFASRR